MPVFLSRLLRRFLGRRTWLPPVAVFAFVFVTSWPLLALAEPGSAVIRVQNYWWWFIVTASTVGYGDLAPQTPMGRAVGGYVIVGGIATLTALFTQLAAKIERTRGQRMRGTATLHLEDHIVVLGYTPGRTERIVDELLADGGRPVALAAWDETPGHPMPESAVEFVRGDLTDEAVLSRAAVPRAAAVLVDARDDNEALAVALVVTHVAPSTHLVVAIREMSRAEHLRYVRTDVCRIQWHSPRLITEELQDPGISEMYAELMTNGGRNTYSIRLPDAASRTFGHCQQVFGRCFRATVLAVRTDAELLVRWVRRIPPLMHTAIVGVSNMGPLRPRSLSVGLPPAAPHRQPRHPQAESALAHQLAEQHRPARQAEHSASRRHPRSPEGERRDDAGEHGQRSDEQDRSAPSSRHRSPSPEPGCGTPSVFSARRRRYLTKHLRSPEATLHTGGQRQTGRGSPIEVRSACRWQPFSAKTPHPT